ncbi:MAG: GNAT family N-acetyltransferase [Anaerolineae bacterium]
MIRKYEDGDLAACAEIMMAVYNNELWQCRWSLETAQAYLQDYVSAPQFAGYTAWEDGKLVGAIFSHEKKWWNNSEIYVDEMFVAPQYQRRGIGKALLNTVESYIRQHHLAGFTLATNRYAPAAAFYRKNGFSDAEHVMFMAKVIDA